MNIFIPIISSILYRLGGRDQMPVPFNQKLFRWVGVGCWLAICSLFNGIGLWSFLLPLTYFVATNWMGYGENHMLRKLLGKDIQWICYGFVLGFASFPSLQLLCLPQSIIGSIATWVLMKWSNDGFHKLPYIGDKIPFLYGSKLNQEYVEIGIGLMGTILYVFCS